MRRQNTGIVTCHLAIETKLWLKTHTGSKIQFAQDTDRIFEDKLENGRTGQFTEKIQELCSTDQRHEVCITEKMGPQWMNC